jgi:hypothetical protein
MAIVVQVAEDRTCFRVGVEFITATPTGVE